MLLTYRVLSISIYNIPNLASTKSYVSEYGISCQFQSDTVKIIDYLTGSAHDPVQCNGNTQTWTTTDQCPNYPAKLTVSTSQSQTALTFCDSCASTKSNMDLNGLFMLSINLILINLPPRIIILDTLSSPSSITINVKLINPGVIRCGAFTSPYTPLTIDAVFASSVLGSIPVKK